ncbi:MAG: hypothetical protein KAS93_08065, partial [Gammaproteobacteria bacterium]|nr:hypothetical protein [Gammaproteobacteria bacterium]
IEHNAALKLVKKYAEDLNDLGDASGIEIRKFKTAGRPGEEAILDEVQTTFLITLMRNSKPVVAFKKRLTKEFFKMRTALAKIAAQQKDANWLEMRKDGKVAHRKKTDVIKSFVDYATRQGSKSASRYYMALAKMENSALFFLEQRFSNVREVLVIRQLMIVSMADDVIENALVLGMEEGLPYKECFQIAKKKVIAFSVLAGRSPILSLELK